MDRRLLESAWPADEPPPGFAERVVAQATAKRPSRRWPAVALLVAAAAGLVVWFSFRPSASGSHLAKERVEVAIGSRAVAVLESGAKIGWRGSRVEQSDGDVFYRVEPGGAFVVNTPAGDVSVLGTCFRVRVGSAKGTQEMKRKDVAVAAGSAALAALAVVTVYEGRVQLSHAGERVTLGAGESGKVGAGGTKKLSADEATDTEASLTAPNEGGALAAANENLSKDISDLNKRLASIEKEKSRLQEQLAGAEQELAKRTDGGAARGRHDFDLDSQDWAELAKEGTVKYRHPCFRANGWKPSPEQMQELGLAPDDIEPIESAYKRSYERLWKTLRPLCAKAVGNAEVADLLGPETCTHVVVDAVRKKDSAGAAEAMRQVGEVRAGLRPAPAPGKEQHPVFDAFYALTGELGAFEADLAQTFGPEEAKRLAYAKGMCAGHSTFGGPGPRGK
ncbi:MAG: FecR domain-containing protein [Myxococcales bacterium]|nr:FecR domain-containing protein [Myxococcales bacterium]